jgi:hypothetical protein
MAMCIIVFLLIYIYTEFVELKVGRYIYIYSPLLLSLVIITQRRLITTLQLGWKKKKKKWQRRRRVVYTRRFFNIYIVYRLGCYIA